MEEFNSGEILKNQNRKKRFGFLEVGLFEVSFILIIIIVFFGLFNYFNILSLSKLYPQQLGFLPRQSATNNQRVKPQSPSPIPTPFTGYDWNYAQITLGKFIRDNIKPEFLPAKIQGAQGLIGADNGRGTEYEFGTKWKTNNEFIIGVFHYGIKTNIQSDVDFLIQVNNASDRLATAPLAETLTQKYLKNISNNSTFSCRTFSDKKTTACENMTDTPSGKKGFGLMISPQIDNGQPYFLTVIFSCFVPKNGIYYNQWSSCINFK